MKHAPQRDPWSQTLAMIDRCTGLRQYHAEDYISRDIDCIEAQRGSIRKGAVTLPPRSAKTDCATIRIIERLSSSTVSLSWNDPTSLNYSEQIWRMGPAPRNGQCVLSDQSIVRGQPVYRPRRCGKETPLNFSDMILASAVMAACAALSGADDDFSVECTNTQDVELHVPRETQNA
jgi:Domain of unknown function (DUF3331)